ncbi:MAG: protein BatD [Bacteroidetes bacterium]|nr:protein BatD [Bacteroidota bacterium]
MKVSAFRTQWLPMLMLLVACSGGVRAQNVVFSANANANKIGLSDQLTVTYTIQDVEGLQSITPSFKEFKVLGGPFQSQSSNTQVLGNRVIQSSSVSLTFILQARHTGKLNIPAATAKDANGRNYQSNPLEIEVVPGSLAAKQPARQQGGGGFWDDPLAHADPFAGMRGHSQPAQQQPIQQAPKLDISKDMFIRVDVDKRRVRLGEQVTAYYKLYTRIPMQMAISKLPSLNGFWTQDFDLPKQPKPTEETVGGKRYQVFVLKKSALFPQQTGKLILDPAEADGTARVVMKSQRRNPFDDPFFQQAFGGSLMLNDPFFSDPFGGMAYRDIPAHVKSTPLTIQVDALPTEGKPESFTGAVGSFNISSKLSNDKLSTDDVTTLTLTISGSGNLKLFDAPKPTLPNGLDLYDPNIQDTITSRSTTIAGDKIITYTIAPRRSGDYTIPPISFSWFDPKTNSYKTASTSPYKLHVTPGKGSLASIGGKGTFNGDIEDNLQAHALKPVILSPVYWALYLLPLLAFAGLAFYRRRQDELTAHADEYRTRKAGSTAQKRLSLAGAMLQKGQEKGFYDELSKAIWLYLSDKLGIPMSSLGKATAVQALAQRGVPDVVRNQVAQLISDCELALYAPVGSSQQMQQSFSEAASVINSLERTLRSS